MTAKHEKPLLIALEENRPYSDDELERREIEAMRRQRERREDALEYEPEREM